MKDQKEFMHNLGECKRFFLMDADMHYLMVYNLSLEESRELNPVNFRTIKDVLKAKEVVDRYQDIMNTENRCFRAKAKSDEGESCKASCV